MPKYWANLKSGASIRKRKKWRANLFSASSLPPLNLSKWTNNQFPPKNINGEPEILFFLEWVRIPWHRDLGILLGIPLPFHILRSTFFWSVFVKRGRWFFGDTAHFIPRIHFYLGGRIRKGKKRLAFPANFISWKFSRWCQLNTPPPPFPFFIVTSLIYDRRKLKRKERKGMQVRSTLPEMWSKLSPYKLQ